MESLEFSIYYILPSANTVSFTTSFPICVPFISFSCLFLWLGLPILCRIKVVRVGLLVPDLKGKAFSFSPLSTDWFQGKGHLTKEQNGVLLPQARNVSGHQKLEEERQDSPLEPSEGALISDFWTLREQTSAVLTHLVCHNMSYEH